MMNRAVAEPVGAVNVKLPIPSTPPKSASDPDLLTLQEAWLAYEKTFKPKQRALTTDEYRKVYPYLKELNTRERKNFKASGERAMKEADVWYGDEVEWHAVGPYFNLSVYKGVIVKSVIGPKVKLRDQLGGKNLIRWHKGFKRSEALSRSVAELATAAAVIVAGPSPAKLRAAILKAGQGTCDEQSFLNCRLFVQLTSGKSKLESLPKIGEVSSIDFNEKKYDQLLRKIKVGDILRWYMGTHFSIYLGKGEMLEVPEWGDYSKPKIVGLDDYDPFETAYRPDWT